MKIILILLLSLHLLFSNNILTEERPHEGGCVIPFFNQEKKACSSTKKEQITTKSIPNLKKQNIKKEKRVKRLNSRANSLKQYKIKSEKEKKILKRSIKRLKKEFKSYKVQKNREIKKLYQELNRLKKRLSKSKNQLKICKKKSKSLRNKVKKLKKKKRIIKAPTVDVEPKIYTQSSLPKYTPAPTPLPSVNNLPWVEVMVEDGLDIYQLAVKYYGDRSKYREIYSANRNVIGKNLKIYDGMSLKIPMLEEFKEQPMILNMD